MTGLAEANAAPGRSTGLGLQRAVLPVLLFGAFAAAPFLAQLGAEGYILSLVIRVMIFGIAAMSLDLILGYGALVSFGHAAFLGLGAYGVGVLMSHAVESAVVQLAAALGLSALFALVTGAISLRTRGGYFIMITFPSGPIPYFVALSLAPFGGDDGLPLPTRSPISGTRVLEQG